MSPQSGTHFRLSINMRYVKKVLIILFQQTVRTEPQSPVRFRFYEIFAYRSLPMICSMTISGEISPPITMSKIAGDAPDTNAAPVSDRETGLF